VIQTRSQQMLGSAIGFVSQVKGEKYAKNYGHLCYDFPIMIMTSGLAQTLGYYESRAAKGGVPGAAYKTFLDHMTGMLDTCGIHPGADRLAWVRDARVDEYMLATQRLLEAAVPFKHLAASLLGVDAATEPDEGDHA